MDTAKEFNRNIDYLPESIVTYGFLMTQRIKAGLDHDATTARRTHKYSGPLYALHLCKPKISFVTK